MQNREYPKANEEGAFAWGITDGRAGMVSQVEGVLKSLNVPYKLKTCERAFPLSLLPSWLYQGSSSFLKGGSHALKAPLPKLVVGCGRRSIPLLLDLKRRKPDIFIVYLHNPRCCYEKFDLIVCQKHDHLEGKNVFITKAAPHKVTRKSFEETRKKFASLLGHFPSPRTVILIGGKTNRYAFPSSAMNEIYAKIEKLLEAQEGSFFMSPSRRTGKENVLEVKRRYGANKKIFLADLEGLNPYMGFLAYGDFFVVTNDSVSMISEVLSTGKPLYILKMQGHENTPPSEFCDALVKEGLARYLGDDSLATYAYSPLFEAGAIAQVIKNKLGIESESL